MKNEKKNHEWDRVKNDKNKNKNARRWKRKESDRGEKEKGLLVWGMVRDFINDGSPWLTKF